MKQFLYVYVPGFEYDSKGPLHIDAIRLDVTTGEIEKEGEKITNSLDTYIYLKGEINDKTNKFNILKRIPGNTIYRVDNTSSSKLKSDRYKPGTNTAETPFWTETIKKKEDGTEEVIYDRVLHGYFYDFITTPLNSELTHHVIGFHNNPKICQTSVSNINSVEHDGLFAVQIEELNTDLVLNFTFYSRISDCSGNKSEITVGGYNSTPLGSSNAEDILKGINEDSTFFFSDKRSDFFDKYIEIGKWSQTYNPATSGVEDGGLIPGTSMNQYFNLRDDNWGTKEENWEVPVNADILVSNFGENTNKLKPKSDSHIVWAQYEYDPVNLIHKQNLSLTCNSKVASLDTYGDYYSNFYNDLNSQIISTYKNLSILAYSCVSHMYENVGIGYFVGHLPIEVCDYYYNDTPSISHSYKLTRINLSNFNYLYKNYPKILLVNVINNSENIDTSSDKHTALVCVVDSSCLDSVNYSFSGMAGKICDGYLWDKLGYIGFSGGKRTITDLCGITNSYARGKFLIKAYLTLPGLDTINILTTNTLQSFLRFNWIDYINPSGMSNKTVANFIWKNEKSRPNKSGSWYNSVYMGTVYDSTSSLSLRLSNVSLLDGGSVDVTLSGSNPKFTLKFDLSSFILPVTAMSKSYYEFTYSWTGDEYDDWYYQRANMHSHWKGSFGLSGYTAPKHTVRIVIPQMYYIDLSQSQISYPNATGRLVIPILTNEVNGYNGKSKNVINIDTTIGNLLDPTPTSTAEYEIERVLSAHTSIIKNNTDLLYYKTGSGKSSKTDSTFCKEKRFIGLENTSSSLNQLNVYKTIKSLTPGLYVLRVLTMYPHKFNSSPITISGKIGLTPFSSVAGRNNRWVFSVNESCDFFLLTVNKSKWDFITSGSSTYDMISGIGLYKVDLSKTDTNTLVLNSTYNAYQESSSVSSFIDPSGHEMIYDYIIFPAAFCAKEDIDFCSRSGGSYTSTYYNSDYKNDYCTRESDDKIHHHYNFHYLPDKAIYEVLAYYSVPKDGMKIDVDAITKDDLINDQLQGKLGFLASEIVRI